MTLSYTREQGLEKLASYIGVPYYYGGQSKKGIDCSGLVAEWWEDIGFRGEGFDITADGLYKGLKSGSIPGKKLEVPEAGALLFFGGSSAGHVVVAISDTHHIGANNGSKTTKGDRPEAYVKIARHDYRVKDYLGCWMPEYGWKKSVSAGTMPFDKPAPSTPANKKYKATSRVNMRSAASITASVVATVESGATVTATGLAPVTAGDYTWVQVKSGDKTGWIANQYLKEV